MLNPSERDFLEKTWNRVKTIAETMSLATPRTPGRIRHQMWLRRDRDAQRARKCIHRMTFRFAREIYNLELASASTGIWTILDIQVTVRISQKTQAIRRPPYKSSRSNRIPIWCLVGRHPS